ncbi:MAB_1171c family putative transporter [Streptomyces sp. NPDC048639]|uniref:MAB_1171c family putative transporter n=1 Tax=Streptomyces sp. NPDC048639 TaxID=3365581 RepID=UPI003716FBBE
MLEPVLTAIDLAISSFLLSLAATKWVSVRRDSDPSLKYTVVVLATAAMAYLVVAPAVYRAIGSAIGSPSAPSLLFYTGHLSCIALAHLLSMLWHPNRTQEERARKRLLWLPTYVGAITVMVVAFMITDPAGPAHPVRFPVAYADLAGVVVLQVVYLITLSVGIVATIRQFRGPDGLIALLPEDSPLAQGMRAFALSVVLSFLYAVCLMTAVLTASLGHHRSDVLMDIGTVLISISGFVVGYGMAKPALSSWLADLRDFWTLTPLWKAAVSGVEEEQVLDASGWMLGDLRFRLSRRLIEILDGIRHLRPLMRSAPSETVRALALTRPELEIDLQAAQAAATIRDAERRLEEPSSTGDTLRFNEHSFDLPGGDEPLDEQRRHMVRVAEYLNHPIVVEALRAHDPSSITPVDTQANP